MEEFGYMIKALFFSTSFHGFGVQEAAAAGRRGRKEWKCLAGGQVGRWAYTLGYMIDMKIGKGREGN